MHLSNKTTAAALAAATTVVAGGIGATVSTGDDFLSPPPSAVTIYLDRIPSSVAATIPAKVVAQPGQAPVRYTSTYKVLVGKTVYVERSRTSIATGAPSRFSIRLSSCERDAIRRAARRTGRTPLLKITAEANPNPNSLRGYDNQYKLKVG